MNRTKIAQLYADADAFDGKAVTVAGGWVKSVRDMKNFGFVTVNDGSCFEDLQVVMDRSSLEKTTTRLRTRTLSAALVVRRRAEAHARRPAALRACRRAHSRRGPLGARLPAAEEARHAGVSAHPAAPAAAHEPVPRGVPHPLGGGGVYPPLLPRSRIRLRAHAHHHGERLREGGRDVPRDHH